MREMSLDKAKIKFLLLEGIHPNAVEVLSQAGYTNVEALPGALEGEALKAKLADVHFLGIRSRTQLTADVFAAAPKLVSVGAFCIGTNQIDLDAAREHGVPVFNAPYSNTRSVAELVLAEALGMHVIFSDVVTKLPLGNAQQVPMATLLREADVVTLHVPELASTQWMIGAAEIAAMKPGAVLINASRGTVVEIEPLAEALKAHKLLGAAIDVFPVEPKSNKDEFSSPLRGIDNVILTPHIGGSTMEAQANIGLEVAEKLVKYSDNGTTTSSVNFPEVALPAHPGKKRLLHIHRNVPGVMTAVNQVLAQAGVNISGQFLQTRGEIGYVVTDIEGDTTADLRHVLDAVPGTLRSRVLF